MKKPKYLYEGAMQTMEDIRTKQLLKLQPTYVQEVENSNEFWFWMGIGAAVVGYWVEKFL